MNISFADIDPGNLTMICVLGLFTVLAAFCLLLAVTTYLGKERKTSRRFFIAAGICFGSGVVLSFVAKSIGQSYGFP